MSGKSNLYVLGAAGILAMIIMSLLVAIDLRSANNLNEDSSGLAMAQARSGIRWTAWFDTDNPSGAGDYELLADIRTAHPEVCATPIAIQCQTTNGRTAISIKQKIACDVNVGLVCQNSLNGKNNKKTNCKDYKVRFGCPVIPPQSCVDSDGGKNYYTKGTIKGSNRYGIVNATADYCGQGRNSNTLIEGYCDNNGYATFNTVHCTNGCSDGMCIANNKTICPLYPTPSPDWCLNGTIVPGSVGANRCRGPPTCQPVACTADAKICPDGTSVGRIPPNCEFAPCPINNSITCSDSDGGEEYNIKGTVHGIQENGNIEISQTDFCMPSNTSLVEYYCNGKYIQIDYPLCPNGCSDGACLSKPAISDNWTCRTANNLLEILPSNTPNFYKYALNKENDVNYGDWNITLIGGNDATSSIIVTVLRNIDLMYYTTSLKTGDVKLMAGLLLLVENISFDEQNNAYAIIDIIPYSSVPSGFQMYTTNTNNYCMNNNLYQKACPDVVTQDSFFIDKLAQNCPYDCYNNACLDATMAYFCNDSDYDNLFKKGKVIAFNEYGQYEVSDYCYNDSTLTESSCQDNMVALKQYQCNSTVGNEENACDSGRCTPSICQNFALIDSLSGITQINAKGDPQYFSVLDYNAESNSILLQINTTSGIWDSWLVEGDTIISNGQDFYVKNVFISNIGVNSGAAQICYESN